MKVINLSSGSRMPIIGLGTFKIQGGELIQKTLDTALQSGYRSIDTASVYRNEADFGECLKTLLPKYKLTREDIFITSKLGPKDQGRGRCREACLRSINNLQTDYLDLFLIHWPGTQGKKPEDPQNQTNRLGSWRDMEDLYKEGKLKAIGVSNYELTHLEELLKECTVPPAVLQIEHHPHLVQTALVKLCHSNHIHFQAYSSLGTSTEHNQVLTAPAVLQLADVYKKTPAQILLRWAVQQDIGIIPKSTNPTHIVENIDIFSFTLTDTDMGTLNSLNKQHHYCWNPSSVS